MGFLTLLKADLVDAGALFREALTLAQRIEDQIGSGWALAGLARLASRVGDHAHARALHRESLAIFRQQGDRRSIAYTLLNLGNVAICLDDLAETRASFRESLIISRRLGDLQAITVSLEGMAEVACLQSQPSRAIPLISAASFLRKNASLPRSPADGEKMDQAIMSAREALGEAAFCAAWDAGQALTLEQAVEYALSL
ncbi:MAG: tetratricopeptide repeat protein [Janthinobacterium lividum]